MNRPHMNINTFFEKIKGKSVAFCGIGITNAPLAEMFLRRGFEVTVCDRREPSQESEAIRRLRAMGASVRLGPDYLSGLEADIVFRTPGLNWNDPALAELSRKGAVITSEMEVFFRVCPAHTIAVTGSCGKTTTAAIIARMLESSGKKVWMGGGMGSAMLPDAEKMSPEDWVVCELSSFHLISMRESPEIALVTNISPNHLNAHRDMAEYVDAMANICRHQSSFDRLVVNGDSPECLRMAEGQRARLMTFSRTAKPERGVWTDEKGDIRVTDGQGERVIMNLRDIRLPGMHNAENFMAAICVTAGLVRDEDILSAAHLFCGVSHRTEFVRCVDGVSYYNDSIATTPERTVKGMLSLFDRRMVLIAGGLDKNLPFEDFARAVCGRVAVLILMGAAADTIERAVLGCGEYDPEKLRVIRVENMAQAVSAAAANAGDGDVVALSPACASLDMYSDFEERGRDFIRQVESLRPTALPHQDDDEDYNL